MAASAALVALSLIACKRAPPPAEFNDALVYAFRSFEAEPEVLA